MPNATTSIESLVSNFVNSIEQVIDAAVAARMAGMTTEIQHRLFGTAPKAPVAKAHATKAPAAKAPTAKPAAAAKGGRAPRLCPVPGCGKPAAGPRYHWKCRDHGTLVVTGKAAAKKATPKAAAPAAKAAKPAAAATGDAALCHFPGCKNKHSGPRYHLFCREHFTSMSPADLEKYKAQWKASHSA